jgi:hypothetical protein
MAIFSKRLRAGILAVGNSADAHVTEVSRRCKDALNLMLTHRGEPFADVEKILADNPKCLLAHCLRVAFVVSTDGDVRLLTESAHVIEATCSNSEHPAHRYAAAAHAWRDGNDALATKIFEAIVVDYPHDILALATAHALDFRLGQRKLLRDRIARVVRKWEFGMFGYASLLSMYAFGLEENGQYRRAEKLARRALAIDPSHPGAMHVVAHVLEMQGRAREGLEFLAATEPAWRDGTGFSVHLAWHRGLFHLDADDPASALAVYDEQIANAPTPGMAVLADASALLWRLHLRNIDVGERWQLLADRWEDQSLTGARPFYVIHAVMALAAASRSNAIANALQTLPYIETTSISSPPPEEALAGPFCEALVAFTRGDYTTSIERLTCVRHITHRCGGSLAQCDLVHLTFTEAALRSSKMRLARALVAERAAQKPASLLNRLLQHRLEILPAMS